MTGGDGASSSPRVRVFIAASLDGYIATADHGLAWLDALPLSEEDGDHGYASFMDATDALVVGRGTFDVVAGFGDDWPYDKPVVVLTTRELDTSVVDGHVEAMTGSPEAVVAALAERGWRSLYLDGGATITQFLAAGLVDEMTITRVPVVLGAGIPLFGAVGEPAWFQHVTTATFSNGMVQTRYRAREAP